MKSSSCLPPSASLWQLGRAGSIPRPRAGGSPVPSRWLRAGWDGGGGAGFPTCGGNYLPTASLPAPGAAAGQGGHLPGRASLAGCRAAVPGPGVAGGTPRRPARPHAAPAGRVRRPPPRLPANVVPSPRAATSVSGGGGGSEGTAELPSPPSWAQPPPTPLRASHPPPPTSGLPGLCRVSAEHPAACPGGGRRSGAPPPRPPPRTHLAHPEPPPPLVQGRSSSGPRPPPRSPPRPRSAAPPGCASAGSPGPAPAPQAPACSGAAGAAAHRARRHRRPTHGPEHAGTGGHPHRRRAHACAPPTRARRAHAAEWESTCTAAAHIRVHTPTRVQARTAPAWARTGTTTMHIQVYRSHRHRWAHVQTWVSTHTTTLHMSAPPT